ncbi:YihY/virulence factor BrkB family protein [Rudaeicoccus suwonensis]|uniref:YihY family inner membrane protein n=1 Tax=Rudaeicoccus suwonensis TaxID=657409 RepID=A0A561E8X8_9MICO|nr:YihY/virulence factor BrkB family protein [Rudaeicoccus suwonensis]TWE12075.1 YihY family inner membrane protein [Rudaeicoccus suwonensis]
MPKNNLIDRIQRRFPPLGFPIAVIYKFFDDMGSYLSALIAYYTFVSLFPMLLLATTVLSLVLDGHPHLQQRLIDSALGEFPVVGHQLSVPHGLSGGGVGVVLSVLAMLYGALGAAQAFQYAANTVWQVPRNERPNPLKARGRSFLLLGTVGLGLLATTALNSLLGTYFHFGALSGWLIELGAVLINVVVFGLAFRLGTTSPEPWHSVLPGAVIAAVLWQVLQRASVTYVRHVIAHASDMNGVFATVLGLLAFLYLAALVIVLSMEIDAVRVKKLYPRALLTPFTDDVNLTGGDKRAYAGQAEATRTKGFEEIEVTFRPPPPEPEKKSVPDPEDLADPVDVAGPKGVPDPEG